MPDFTYTVQTLIPADRPTLWQHVTQMRHVNDELMPFVRMTYPADRASLAGQTVPMGTVLFRSVILLFGILPIDLHLLAFDKIEDNKAFYENSTTLTHRYWKHTRSLTDTSGGTIVKDEVHFSPRLPLIGYLFLPIYTAIFRHRHRQLARAFK
ncbi:MAG: hypothetical protein JST83_06610 [Bacteroidetes bacterium]|nr:hypothetical protein [Bacteroidota bacterium]